jgi:hypothetical protein
MMDRTEPDVPEDAAAANNQTSVARAILSALDYIPTVLILSQDAFYRKHTQEEIDLAFKSDLDLGTSGHAHVPAHLRT